MKRPTLRQRPGWQPYSSGPFNWVRGRGQKGLPLVQGCGPNISGSSRTTSWQCPHGHSLLINNGDDNTTSTVTLSFTTSWSKPLLYTDNSASSPPQQHGLACLSASGSDNLPFTGTECAKYGSGCGWSGECKDESGATIDLITPSYASSGTIDWERQPII